MFWQFLLKDRIIENSLLIEQPALRAVLLGTYFEPNPCKVLGGFTGGGVAYGSHQLATRPAAHRR